MNFDAVILAGGRSSRMGRDKAFLEIEGEPLLARQIRLAREVGATEVFISGRPGVDYSIFGCRVFRDEFSDAGPLAGIERALQTSSSLLLVLATDLPQMKAMFLRQLWLRCTKGRGAIPKFSDHVEPLAAFYPAAAGAVAKQSLYDKHNSVAGFAEKCVQSSLAWFVDCEAVDQKFFSNWNSPEDITPMMMGNGKDR